MNAPENNRVDELLQNFSAEPVPADVNARLSEQLRAFRDRLADRADLAGSPARRNRLHGWTWRVLTSVAAVGLAAALVIWLTRPSMSLAQAAEATMKQPWIHIAGKLTNGVQREVWFSVPRGVGAARYTGGEPVKERVQFHDFAQKTRYTFVSPENVLYKTSDRDEPEEGKKELDILERLQDQLLAGKPLSDLDLFGKDGGPKILEQKTEKVVENGREWLEVRIEAKFPPEQDPVKVVIRLDAQAKLFHSMRCEGTDRGKPIFGEFRFDYPKQGPADIYALGVPKEAKLIESAPANVQQIAKQLRADASRMDPYRAVVVQQMLDDQGKDITYFNLPDTLVEHKGDCYRTSYWSGSIRDGKWTNTFGGYQVPCKPGDDPRKWWLERIHDLTFQPFCISRDGANYNCESKTELGLKEVRPDRPQFAPKTTITAVNRVENASAFPPNYGRMPEFACRPPMGVGGEGFEPSLNLKPEGGPPGCILLRLHRLAAEQNPNQRPGTKQGDLLFWLDPARDHVAVRWDLMAVGPDGKEFAEQGHTIEEMAKSPSGVWYATKVREIGTWFSNGEETKLDAVYYLYVDFDAKMADELFATPAVGMTFPGAL